MEPEIFAIFQHKVERTPHFTRVTEVRHMFHSDIHCCFLWMVLILTCPASFLPHAHTAPSVSMATMNSDPQARCTTFLSLMRVTITGHFYNNMRNTDALIMSTVMGISFRQSHPRKTLSGACTVTNES